MTKKRASIADIASEVGVSPSTVSRALGDHSSISVKVKEQVRAVAERLHYIPNPVAVNLKSGRKQCIGVIVPSISRHFFASAIEGVEDYAQTRGYDVIICQHKDSAEREEMLVHSLKGKVDGVIASLSSANNPHHYYNTLQQIGTPLVLFDRTDNALNASNVSVDDYQGAKKCVEHLWENGCRTIYHFAGPQNVGIWKSRYEGYLSALRKQGVTPEPNWVYEAPTIQEEGVRFARQILSEGKLPDGIFFSGDFVALGALLHFKNRGIRIPDEIAIVGFANEPFCGITTPTLSSVEQFSYRQGQISCKMLFERLDGEPPVNTIIMPELVIRESSSR